MAVRKLSLIPLFLLLLLCPTTGRNNDNYNEQQQNKDTAATLPDALGPDSVVLITGAAGFLGSELALALHRTYEPRTIICIDSMDQGFGTTAGTNPNNNNANSNNKRRSDPELALFEFKRQRVFRLLQTLGTTAVFFRTDLRPVLPQYHDSGPVPVLARIFAEYPDITHVVHLADHYHRGYLNPTEQAIKQQQHSAVPRRKGQAQAGMMEAILEQIRQHQEQQDTSSSKRNTPHFVYASTGEVYNHHPINATLRETKNRRATAENLKEHDVFRPPFREDFPITRPSTVAGVTKLLDELTAQAYFEMHNIFSVGLRFFPIYGPWGLPGSPTFEMAERLVAGNHPLVLEKDTDNNRYPFPMSELDDIRDYLYVDDAIDALMAAMQFRPLVDPDSSNSKSNNKKQQQPRPIVINVGSGEGTTLRTMAQTLVKLFPGNNNNIQIPTVAETAPPTVSYASISRAQSLLGFRPRVSLDQGLEKLLAWHYERSFPYGTRPDTATLRGYTTCGRYDAECLQGTPVFPCASECAHPAQCIPSFWDDVVAYTRALTSGCHAVLYTLALEENLALLPSTIVRVSEQSIPFVQPHNNENHHHHPDDQNNNCNIAFVSETSHLYQKLVYLRGDQHIVQHGSWRLVPVHLSETARANDALLVLPKLSPGLFFSLSTRQAIYCDPDIIIHNVPKLLLESRKQPYSGDKDIHGTTVLLLGKQQPADPQSRSNRNSNIHNTTTRWQDQVQAHAYRMVRIALIDEMAGDGFSQPIDSSLVVHSLTSDDGRLFRCDVFGEMVQWAASTEAWEFVAGLHDMWSRVMAHKSGHEPWWIGDQVRTVEEERRLQEQDSPSPSINERRRLVEMDDAADDAVVVPHNGFGNDAESSGNNNENKRVPVERHEVPEMEDDEFELGDDWEQQILGDNHAPLPEYPKARDASAIDVWMGILSSTPTRSFARIVDLEAVGAVRIDNYDELAHAD